MERQVIQAATWLATAHRVVVLSGAGMSQESGIPTFRDAQSGLWGQYDPMTLASQSGFIQDPGLVWRWYGWRRALVDAARPNPGHLALAALAALVPRLVVITQNVDGLHQAAGSTDVIELHGNLCRFRCFARGHPAPRHLADCSPDEPPPCPICRSLLRPDVIWFGEALPRAQLDRAFDEVKKACLMLVVGTSGLVQPAAQIPVEALRRKIRVIEINREATPLTDHVPLHLRGASGELLPVLVAQLETLRRVA